MNVDWAADVKKYVPDADDGAIAGIVRHCGIALQSRDASLVSFTDSAETDRVRESFLKRKLGLTQSDGELDAVIAEVGQRMSGEHFRNRVTVYYLLAQHFGMLHRFIKADTTSGAPADAAPDAEGHTGAALGAAGAAVAGAAALGGGAVSGVGDAVSGAASVAGDGAHAALGAVGAAGLGAAALGSGAVSGVGDAVSGAASVAGDGAHAALGAVGAAGLGAAALAGGAVSGVGAAVGGLGHAAMGAVGGAVSGAVSGVTGAAAAGVDHVHAALDDGYEPAKRNRGWLMWLLLGLALLALLLWLFGCQPKSAVTTTSTATTTAGPDAVASAAPTSAASAAASAPSSAAASGAPAPADAAPDAGVTTETRDGKPLVKVFFRSGSAWLVPAFQPAAETLKSYIAAHAGAKLAVSGFADKTGNAEVNAAISKERAKRVRDALVAAGVAEGAVALVKPADSVDAANANGAARRVEVSVQ